VLEPVVVESPQRLPVALRDQCIHELFEAQARRSPNATALVFEGRQVSYRRLNIHAERFAARLHCLGLGQGSYVALYAPRSLETIISLLGILKAGAAYVALDMESPAERLELMLSVVQPAAILTLHPLVADLPLTDAAILYLNEEFDLSDDSPFFTMSEREPAAADDLAYVAFTSGSTGEPKGVCITHRAVVRLAKSADFVSPRREDAFLQFAPLSFDASTFEVWSCLLNGAKLAIFPPWKPSLTDLAEFIEVQGVSILWLSAALFHQLTESHLHHFGRVRVLLTGGDVVSVPHAEKALRTLKNCRLVNGYGPTENTTFSCCHTIVTIPERGGSIPIGRPVAGTECHVLDEHQRAVPRGEPGELYVGGDGLAAGYLGNPALTAAKFIPHPFVTFPGNRLYRTGDLVRMLPDGNLEFLGRMDRQVKILGYRVELTEIEAILRRHPAVNETSAFVQRTIAGEERLVAAVVVKLGATAGVSELRAFVQRSLPPHMIPSDFVFLEEFPLNANGKIDHAALAASCSLADLAPPGSAADSGLTARRLAKIWSFVLGRPDIGGADNFFELGGNSLRAAHLLARVQKEFRRSIPMARFFTEPTLQGLASLIDSDDLAVTAPVCMSRSGGSKPGLFCLPGQGGEMTAYLRTVEHFSGDRPIYGLPSPAFIGGTEGITMEEIAALHVQTICALQPEGPYHVFGFCFGGLLAFETARQLREAKQEVGFVGVLQFDIHDLPAMPFRFTRPASFARFLSNSCAASFELLRLERADRDTAVVRVLTRLLGMPADCAEVRLPMNAERRLYETHETAWRSYVPRAVLGVVTLLRPQRLPIFHPDPHLGWASIDGQQVEVEIVPADGIHGSMLKDLNAREAARLIEKATGKRELELSN